MKKISEFKDWSILDTNYEVLGAVTIKKFTVPSGKRWTVWGGYCERDVEGTLLIEIYDANDKLVALILSLVAGTSNMSWGVMCMSGANVVNMKSPFPLDTGMYIKYTWGAEQTSPEVTCLITETPYVK